ncbi:MAG: YdiY family protein [Oligosphaeraceae bacterium]
MRKLLFLFAFSLLLPCLLADRIVLNDGSVLNGTLKSIANGTLVLATDFAGDLKIPAQRVVKLDTVGAVEIATQDGQRVQGRLNTHEPAPAAGEATGDAPAAAPMALALGNVKYLWTAGMEDPTLPPARKWDGEFSLDISGKTGNSEKFNGGAGALATLAGPVDKLKLHANASYGREDHNTNTKKYLAGADYEHKLLDCPTTWYVSGELEQQPTSGLRLRQEVGAGFGYYLLQQENSSLRLRAGLSAKARKYTDGSHNDTMGAQLGLRYERNIQEWGKLVTELTLQPSLENFHDYRALHESSLDIPLVFQYPLSLRLGISNEYNSRVSKGSERMETNYFAKMVFKWK